MKKTAIALAVALALAGLTTAAQAAPQDDSWYTGAKLGWSQFYKVDLDGPAGYNVSDSSVGRNHLAAGAYLGYQANQYLGFELGYDWLGRMRYGATPTTDSAAFKAQGVQLTTRLSYPVMNDLDLYTRLGGMVWRADSSTSAGFSNHDTGVSPLVALGAEYALNDNWATRLDYQWTRFIGHSDTTGGSIMNGTLSLGVAYRFGKEQAPAPVIAPTPTPVPPPAVETQRFALRSDVLFAFAKDTLKPEGQQALDQLYTQLSAMDPKDGSVVVIGFTDRIGSEQANLALSERRAQSVVNYLVSKGIPADKISARGMGKANPVTGSTCDNVRNREALIECLAPDRRVEIEVKGIKEVISQPQG